MSGYSTHEQQRNDLSEEKAESRRLVAELDALKKYPTIERPMEPGWYWYRLAPNSPWIMMEVFLRFGSQLWVAPPTPSSPSELGNKLRGEWRGPIPEPAP